MFMIIVAHILMAILEAYLTDFDCLRSVDYNIYKNWQKTQFYRKTWWKFLFSRKCVHWCIQTFFKKL